VNQLQQMFQMHGAQPKGGGARQWSDQQSQLFATPPQQVLQAWGEDHRQQSNETTEPQSPVVLSFQMVQNSVKLILILLQRLIICEPKWQI